LIISFFSLDDFVYERDDTFTVIFITAGCRLIYICYLFTHTRYNW